MLVVDSVVVGLMFGLILMSGIDRCLWMVVIVWVVVVLYVMMSVFVFLWVSYLLMVSVCFVMKVLLCGLYGVWCELVM